MARDRVSSSSFGQFMVSTAGRGLRGVIGAALVVTGIVLGGASLWVLASIGVVLGAAGVFDFCVITGLVDNVWSGRDVRARSSHVTTAKRA
jgi:hypothetical protein